MKPLLYILNGSNLDYLGKREPHLYGSTTLAEVQSQCEALASDFGMDCIFRQTNHEGVMVDWLHEVFDKNAALVINPAGFSFASIPVLDAIKMIQQPIVEVHITNIHKRDAHYQRSLVSLAATGVICGLGVQGYELGVRAVVRAMLSK
jgi:3-dehydroquinate dehydratase-2